VNYPPGSVGAYPFATIEDVGPPRFQSYGPWINVVGADVSDAARRAAWPRTHALIQSAIHNTLSADQEQMTSLPAGAYVWTLAPDGLMPFATYAEALAYVREAIAETPAAAALFDKANPHWPYPVGWYKSDDPSYEAAISSQIARSAPLTRANQVAFAAEVSRARQLAGHSPHVGATAAEEARAPQALHAPVQRDFTLSPQWSEIRSLIQGAITSVVESDAIANAIGAHVIQYLTQQGLFAGGQLRPADFLRSSDWAKIKGAIRRAVPQIVYRDEALVDAFARLFLQHARSRVSGDVVGDGFPWGYEIVGAAPPWGDIIGPQPWHDRLADTRFRSWTGYKPGQTLDPHDPHEAAMIPIWLEIHAEVMRESQPYVSGEPWVDIVGGEPWQSIVGGEPWVSIVGQALDVLRKQAQVAAEEMPSRVIGVVRDANNQWVVKSFGDADVADDWFGRVIRDKSRFTYAAYFDKGDPLFPHPLNEEIGGAHAPAVPPSPIPRVIAEVP
jgi:hypothetical protein